MDINKNNPRSFLDDVEQVRLEADVRRNFDLSPDSPVVARVRLCVDLLIYYRGGVRENRDGILDFYQRSMDIVGTTVKFQGIDRRGRMKKVTEKSFDLLPFWLSDSAAQRSEYGLVFESGEHPSDVSDTAFHFYHGTLAPGCLRLILPVEFLKGEGKERFLHLTEVATRRLRILAGSAGFAVNMAEGFPSQQQGGHIYKISRRYHGIDLGDPMSFAKFMKFGIKCVNWLTFLSETVVERLGGVSGLRSTFSELGEVEMHQLEYGMMVRAGALPGFGFVNRQERLAAYHQAGAVLRSVRVPPSAWGRWNDVGGSENLHQWLARFDY